jgi:hypothetical protein
MVVFPQLFCKQVQKEDKATADCQINQNSRYNNINNRDNCSAQRVYSAEIVAHIIY